MPRHRLGHIATALGKAGVFVGILTYSAVQLCAQILPLSALQSYLHATDASLVSLLLRLGQNTVTLCACVSASVCVRIVLAVCFGVTRFLVDVLATVWFFFAAAKESLLSGVLRRFRRNAAFFNSYLENCVYFRRFVTRPGPTRDDTDSEEDTSGSEDEMLFGSDAPVLSERRPFRGRTFLMLFFGVPMVMMWALLLILPSIRTGLRRRIRNVETSHRFATTHSERQPTRGAEELRFTTQKTQTRPELCKKAPGRGKRERCAVCLHRKSRVRLVPCGHDRLCERCATRIMDPDYQYSGICPLCRTSVEEVVTGK
ncbi:uncharacterized protein LOC118430715 [Branchiostoma floridae]|uniref:Uncharacterized protein LOC118430715 n=1 Tax=Branchiostoma floridae TaxID=7739 RepID=C3ZK23_BRAFL|nr:uncharacterized protein LOC118430715 [Branchiostoma floridae]|eukprot:XP_002591110.1 hypothetical protein BRAFLDRAFT_108719 [Branchiostoma floridae]